jgi:hypothetical protein
MYQKIFKKDENRDAAQLADYSSRSIERPGEPRKRKISKRRSNRSALRHSFEAPAEPYTADQHHQLFNPSKPKAVKSRPPGMYPYTPARKKSPSPYGSPRRYTAPFRSDLEYYDEMFRQRRQPAPTPIMKEKPVEQVQPAPLPVKKAVKSRPPEPTPIARNLELVVRVSMKNKVEAEEIHVHEGDTAKELCNAFCVKHKITDREKQFGLLKSLEKQIEEHRSPPLVQPPVVYQAAAQKDTRGAIDPDIRRRVLDIFNEVFYDYDEEDGEIKMERYKQIMKFVKAKENIPDFPRAADDPFSEHNLEAAYHREDNIKYSDKDKVDGKISHRSVMYICHDIFADIIAKAKAPAQQPAAQRKVEPKRNEELAKIEARLRELDVKMDELDQPMVNL